MRSTEVESQEKWNARRAYASAFFGLLLISFLPGCLPGFKSDDDVGAPLSPSDPSPAVNRSYKANFLPFQTTTLSTNSSSSSSSSLGSSKTPGFITAALATLNPLQDAQPSSPSSWAPDNGGGIAEPAVLPPAQSLKSFYEALAALSSGKRKEPVSIVHLGDDHIADDRFSGELREHFLSRFGNSGRGIMMPALFPLRDMRVDRGGRWTLASSAAGSPGSYGITGVRVSSGASDAWMRFTSVQGTFDWVEVAFASGPAQGAAIVSVDGVSKLVPTATPALEQTSIRIAAKGREIVIRPRGDGEVAVLSVTTGINGPGIRYANLGLPGASAITATKWNADFVASDLKKLHPDLIILGYGTHEGFEDRLDISQYEMRLGFLIAQLKQWVPQASLLIIGPPDAARLPGFAGSAGAQVCRSLNAQEIAIYDRMLEREDERLGRWHAPPKLDAVRSALRRAAVSNGAYYWDWAKFMGGPCSIHAWASAKPPLAAPDHITITTAGNERSARALFTELIHGFDAYQRPAPAPPQVAAAATVRPVKPVKHKASHKAN